jgi:pimeloyl-ACP methyl ester carboxylesterase
VADPPVAGRVVHLPGRGRTFVLEAAGPPGAPAVVLLHGLAATATLNWGASISRLARHYRVIAPDQRGHGRGLRSFRPFTLEDCADDIPALTDVFGVSRVVAVGYSMGGPVALLARRRHPERIAGLVLCATSAYFGSGSPRRSLGKEYMKMTLRFTPLPVRQQMMAAMLRSDGAGHALDPGFAEEIRRHDPLAVMDAAEAVARFDARSWLGNLGGPAASVVTVRDRMVAPERQRQLARETRAEVLLLDADHDVAMRQPELFATALLEACRIVADRAGMAPAR